MDLNPQPSQVGKREKKRKSVPRAGIEPRTLRLQVLHLTARLKLQSAITLVKIARIYSKVNQAIYSSSPISWPSFKLVAHILPTRFSTMGDN